MSSVVRVLQFSPHHENCGVGKYEENFVAVFQKMPGDIETDFFDVSPYQTRVMDDVQLQEVLQKLSRDLASYDVLHIQHEFGLFSGEEFAKIVDIAKEAGKKVVVTVHLSPALAFKIKPREGVGPRSLLHVARQKRLHGIFKDRHISAFKKADLLVTHNNGATESLWHYGISRDKILQYNHPVLDSIDMSMKSTEIADKLQKQDNDVLFATIGFMHKYKGITDAVKALKYLPDNYKLAIIGGMQPISDEKNIYNTIADLIDQLNLRDRVYITGYVADDQRLNALIREVDICVYPYDNTYYGQVSSGALNLAFANERPVIAYPTDGFKDLNKEDEHLVLCSTFAYYELAREIQRIDIIEQKKRIKDFSQKNSWSNIAKIQLEAYQKLIGS
jgi:glycosyltransferase involved in cell wall biosynthesis